MADEVKQRTTDSSSREIRREDDGERFNRAKVSELVTSERGETDQLTCFAIMAQR